MISEAAFRISLIFHDFRICHSIAWHACNEHEGTNPESMISIDARRFCLKQGVCLEM